MKFGGTSVGTQHGRAAIVARTIEALEGERFPVVVVSAMGRAGDPYATDTLLALVDGAPDAPRDRDLIAATGETISAVVVAHELRTAGLAARVMTGADAGIITDGVHSDATITAIDTAHLLRAVDERVIPVVCGFQGNGPDGSLTTLGRGGSDTTACALGVALEAREVVIYTDVDGVMTADPRTCDGARVLEVLHPEELFQLARGGGRVVHPPAAELALSSGLDVRVRNTYSDHPGTRVADMASYRPDSVATAVTHVDGVSRVRIALPGQEGLSAHTSSQAQVYRAMADAGISLDMFTPACGEMLFTVPTKTLQSVADVLHELGLSGEFTSDLAKVTLVGAGMHGVPGVMARVAESLAEAGVAILQTADSHTTISVLVSAADAKRAIAALHDSFELSR